ncbi:MAG: NFACT RNA binding domain-containing protein [Candidatus Pacearchaeota archaeon]
MERKSKFREYETSSGKKVLAGKSAENNEELVKQIEKNEDVFHTAKPGSPFVNIKSSKTTEQDKREVAIFCAAKSKDWRDNKKDIDVHYFKGKDIYKRKDMSIGTFGVKKFKLIKIKKREIENFLERKK